jgi:hypothetical protein
MSIWYWTWYRFHRTSAHLTGSERAEAKPELAGRRNRCGRRRALATLYDVLAPDVPDQHAVGARDQDSPHLPRVEPRAHVLHWPGPTNGARSVEHELGRDGVGSFFEIAWPEPAEHDALVVYDDGERPPLLTDAPRDVGHAVVEAAGGNVGASDVRGALHMPEASLQRKASDEPVVLAGLVPVKGEDGEPVPNLARNSWVTATALSTALNMSYMAEQMALFGIVVGIALLLTGIGLIILALTVLGGAFARSGDKARTSRHAVAAA